MSQRFHLNSRADWSAILKAIAYAGGAAAVVSAIRLLPQIEFPVQYVWLGPLINVFLVMAKKFFENK